MIGKPATKPRFVKPTPALPAPTPLATLSAAAYDAKVHPQVARALARAGTPKAEAAVIIGIDEPTLDAWCATYPPFAQAMREGRAFADARVDDTLFRRAVGYDFEETTVEDGPKGRTVTMNKKHVPGNVEACIFWMRAHGKQPVNR